MSRSAALRMPGPLNMGYLFLGIVLGTAYGMSWRFGFSSTCQHDRRSQEAARPRIVCFGDSLTQFGFDAERAGWLALLAHWWERRFDVVNRGFSGYNTRWLLPLTSRLFVEGKTTAPIKLVMVFLGANDSVLPGNAQYVPLKEYKSNLKAMVAHVRKVLPKSKVLLIAPPPVHEAKWAHNKALQQRDMDRRLEVTSAYATACEEVGMDVSVPVVNAFRVMGAGDQLLADKYLHDGVHFTADGNRALFIAVQEVIIQEFPELDPNTGAAGYMQAPYFGDVDPTNHVASVLRGI